MTHPLIVDADPSPEPDFAGRWGWREVLLGIGVTLGAVVGPAVVGPAVVALVLLVTL